MMKIKTEAAEIFAEYQEGVDFNNTLDLYETVERNENFYNDKQWEGVKAPNLDKPQFNIIKPAVNYYIAQLVSDDIGINLEFSQGDYQQTAGLDKIITKELYSVMETTGSAKKHRQLLRNMAVDGDMVLYSYFDSSVDTGQPYGGAIQTEIVHNTDIYFGNPREAEVQKQPYVILKQRRLLPGVKEEATANGRNPEDIIPDSGVQEVGESGKQYVTVLIKFWKENGTVWYTKVTPTAVVKPATDLRYRLYPISFASWETVKNSYHGVSPVTGKINNQIFINKLYAMAMAYTQSMAFPKVIYDRTRLPGGWNNDLTKAVAVNGNPQEAVFSTFKPADMSGHVQQMIKGTIQQTKDSMGIYDAALGNVKPDNTSAIIATQKAASAPLDLQRLDFYQFVEDTVRIWLDIMIADYGVRMVALDGLQEGMSQMIPFDFSQVGDLRYKLNIEIGAASYWSELMQVQTLDNLMSLKIIPDAVTYLENVPDGYIKNKQKIIEKIREQQQQKQQAQQLQQAPPMQQQM